MLAHNATNQPWGSSINNQTFPASQEEICSLKAELDTTATFG